MKQVIRANLDELISVLAGVQSTDAESLINALKTEANIFLMGKGRPGMVMGMFAMRLMHLGLSAHMIGESTTPVVRTGDLLVIASGSGDTESCLVAARKARLMGVTVALLTAAPDSPISRISNVLVILPAHHKAQVPKTGSLMPAGTIFEQSLLIFCDCVCARLATDMNKAPASIIERHANIE